MLLDLVGCFLFFIVTVVGLGWPVAARFALSPAEKLCATALLSLLAIYLIAFGVYAFGLPVAALYVLPVLASASLLTGRRMFATALSDPDARPMLAGLLLVAGWCTGWLFFIASYSGGGWASDWFEHWDRARFFLEHGPLGTKFLGAYALPARPPLANLVTGAFLAVTEVSFAHYQLITTLLNTLAFFPAALLVRRFGGSRTAIAVLAVLLMVNPSFVENATFAWTKLITVFFILTGLYFFLRTLDSDPPRAAGPLCAAALAAGLLTHFSAGPYVLLLAAAWLGCHHARWRDAAFWWQTAQLGLIGGLLLSTWFGWSLAVYGPRTTFLSNSSVTSEDARHGSQLLKIALNLRDTIVPHFLRTFDTSLIAQRSPWGLWRDWFFQLYQVNLLFVFGSVGWLALAVELFRSWRLNAVAARRFWMFFAGGGILIGVAVHGARDTWGLAHICLQTIVVLGLTFLAARWARLACGWRLALIAGATADLLLGIGLQFAAQSYAFDRWFLAGRPPGDYLMSYSEIALMNLRAKILSHFAFFADVFTVPPALVLALLAAILMLALVCARSAQPEP